MIRLRRACALFVSLITAITATAMFARPLRALSQSPTVNCVQLTVLTGNDDARADSVITDTFLGDSGGVTYQGTVKYGTGVWGNNSSNIVQQQVPSIQLSGTFRFLRFGLVQHPSGLEDWDNWDLAGFTVDLYNTCPAPPGSVGVNPNHGYPCTRTPCPSQPGPGQTAAPYNVPPPANPILGGSNCRLRIRLTHTVNAVTIDLKDCSFTPSAARDTS
jgi:hypothetical protein